MMLPNGFGVSSAGSVGVLEVVSFIWVSSDGLGSSVDGLQALERLGASLFGGQHPRLARH